MKVHFLKIKEEYAKEKDLGNKMFEIRKNDKDFKVGDFVRYIVVNDDGIITENENECLENKLFEITYITDYEQKRGFVVFGEKEVIL